MDFSHKRFPRTSGQKSTSMDVPDQVFEFLQRKNVEAYVVGGWVRDQLLGRTTVRDIDLVVKGDAAGLARAFADKQAAAFYLMDEEHDVARVLLEQTYVDFARLRGSLEQDLATRDLTINAMATPMPIDRSAIAEHVVDPFGGREDLASSRIRAVSDAAFRDDPVRLLRAIRISAELDFSIEPHTGALIRRDAGLLQAASKERARDELFKILAMDQAGSLLRLMDAWGLLGVLLPEVEALRGVTQPEPHAYDVLEHSIRTLEEIVRIQANDYVDVGDGAFRQELRSHLSQFVSAERARAVLLRLIGLAHDVGKAVTRSVDRDGDIHFYGHEPEGARIAEGILRRLRLSVDEIRLAQTAIGHHLRPLQLAREPRVSNRAVYRFFRDTGATGLDVCVLSLADTRAKGADQVDETKEARLREVLSLLLDRYFRARESVIAPPPLVDGRELIRELHIPAGPAVGRLLEAIREAQVEGKVTTRDQAVELARSLVARPIAGRRDG